MTLTQGLLFFGIIAIAVVDFTLLIKRGYDATMSWTIWKISTEYPILAFLFGVMAGHLFFPNHAPCQVIP